MTKELFSKMSMVANTSYIPNGRYSVSIYEKQGTFEFPEKDETMTMQVSKKTGNYVSNNTGITMVHEIKPIWCQKDANCDEFYTVFTNSLPDKEILEEGDCFFTATNISEVINLPNYIHGEAYRIPKGHTAYIHRGENLSEVITVCQ